MQGNCSVQKSDGILFLYKVGIQRGPTSNSHLSLECLICHPSCVLSWIALPNRGGCRQPRLSSKTCRVASCYFSQHRLPPSSHRAESKEDLSYTVFTRSARARAQPAWGRGLDTVRDREAPPCTPALCLNPMNLWTRLVFTWAVTWPICHVYWK